jgi:hypothetical protein
MKIWEVKLATEDGELGGKLVAADDYQQAVDLVMKAALEDTEKYSRLTSVEKRSLHVEKVELYCETDLGK